MHIFAHHWMVLTVQLCYLISLFCFLFSAKCYSNERQALALYAVHLFGSTKHRVSVK